MSLDNVLYVYLHFLQLVLGNIGLHLLKLYVEPIIFEFTLIGTYVVRF
jgi:hypothetical protein